MIGEVFAVLSALKALNDGIATVKEGKGNLDSILGNWAEADEKYNEVEKAKAGAMSYKDALKMESAKRQLANFDQQLKDICMMQGQYDLYTSIKKRMEESRYAHEKELRIIKKRRLEFKKTMKLVGTIMFTWAFLMILFVCSNLGVPTTMIMAFLLVVIVDGAQVSDGDMLFQNIYTCNKYANAVERGESASDRQPYKWQENISAYCIPKMVSKDIELFD